MEATLITLAAGRGQQQRGGQSAHVQDADQVDVDDLAEFIKGLLLDRPVVAYPGIVDQHVEPAERLEPLDQRLPVVGVGDVAGDRLDPLAALAGQFVEEVSAPGGRQHGRARLVQDAREPRAEAR